MRMGKWQVRKRWFKPFHKKTQDVDKLLSYLCTDLCGATVAYKKINTVDINYSGSSQDLKAQYYYKSVHTLFPPKSYFVGLDASLSCQIYPWE